MGPHRSLDNTQQHYVLQLKREDCDHVLLHPISTGIRFYVRTVNFASRAAQADVVEACDGQTAVLASIQEALLLPPHVNVGVVPQIPTPGPEYRNTNLPQSSILDMNVMPRWHGNSRLLADMHVRTAEAIAKLVCVPVEEACLSVASFLSDNTV